MLTFWFRIRLRLGSGLGSFQSTQLLLSRRHWRPIFFHFQWTGIVCFEIQQKLPNVLNYKLLHKMLKISKNNRRQKVWVFKVSGYTQGVEWWLAKIWVEGRINFWWWHILNNFKVKFWTTSHTVLDIKLSVCMSFHNCMYVQGYNWNNNWLTIHRG